MMIGCYTIFQSTCVSPSDILLKNMDTYVINILSVSLCPSLPASPGIMCGPKVTLLPTMPNGEQPPHLIKSSGSRTLNRTLW